MKIIWLVLGVIFALHGASTINGKKLTGKGKLESKREDSLLLRD